MAGGPSRSKACANCKSRRIKCDETRPTCNRCQKAGLQCVGYKQQTKFVDETYWIRGKHDLVLRTRPPSHSQPSSSLTPSSTSRHGTEEEEEGEQQQHKVPVLFHSSSELQRKLDPDVVQFLRGTFVPRGADFTSWYHSRHYHGHYYSEDGVIDGDDHHRRSLKDSSSWTMSKRPFLPGVTLQALALGLHGQRTRNDASLHQAAALYGFAVRHLRLDLIDNTVAMISPRVVPLMESIFNLTLYEMIQTANDSARNYHIQALEKLIEMQGPHAFKQAPAKRLFMRARSIIVIKALEENKGTFLAEEQWQTIPWSSKRGVGGRAEKKSFIDRFLDILCCIPSVTQDLDSLPGIPTEHERKQMVASIRASIASLNDRLFDIRLDWEILKPRAAHEVSVSNRRDGHGKMSMDDEGNQLFDSIVYYQDLQSCTEIGIYYSCLFILRSIASNIGDTRRGGETDTTISMMTRLSNTTNQSGRKNNVALKLPHEITSARDAAREMCRSVEYYLQPCHGITGAYFCMLPLRLAQFAFSAEEDRRLASWIRGIMRYIGDTHGFHNAYMFCDG